MLRSIVDLVDNECTIAPRTSVRLITMLVCPIGIPHGDFQDLVVAVAMNAGACTEHCFVFRRSTGRTRAG